ncbi:MAG: 50S ribosomal protein L24 [Muribaculaceae bacterium]|nr:50S ribosomal protein L24 [Muribaculaceae bacterium]
MAKYHIKKGDEVIVIAGDDKGKKGRVLEVIVKKGRAIVEGVNIIKKSTKPTAKYPQGGIVEMEAPVNVSNLSLIDPKSGKATRIGYKFVDGKKVRYSKKSGEEIK